VKKCKGCQWNNKPFWSIVNPCDNCSKEETNVEVFTRWQDPTIEEKDKEIERLKEEKESWKRVATKNFNVAEDYKSIIKEIREDIKYCIPVLEQEEEMSTDERSRKETGELRELLKKRLEILDKENK
jgi:hypothetical protein